MFTEDLSVFFDVRGGFAELVTYDGRSDVAMIFDAAFFEDRLGRVGVESSKPACVVKAADVLGVAHGKVIVRPVGPGRTASTTYHVVGVEPDGTGITLLVLEKQ